MSVNHNLVNTEAFVWMDKLVISVTVEMDLQVCVCVCLCVCVCVCMFKTGIFQAFQLLKF